MSFGEILNTLLLGPIKYLFETVFSVVNTRIENPGISIICLSLVINVLVLPLYMRADVMQKRSREKELQLKDGIAHIKKTFSGDERMMILQTYYRQNHYSPFSALQGSTSLLLQIPFFMAAVQVLSNLPALRGASLGPIADLGAPDGLIVIGGVSVNLLPILMTAVNFVSSALFSKGDSLKTKLQLYGMALFFLVFLYAYPSGLVFYWLLNNVFSLVKTVFYKLKNPKKVLSVLLSVLGAASVVLSVALISDRPKSLCFFLLLGLGMQLPLLGKYLARLLPKTEQKKERKPQKSLFLLSSLLLTVITGLLIPSAVIASSPEEFIAKANGFHHPLWFVLSAFLFAAGTFLVWMRIFYWLASDKGKCIFDRVAAALCGAVILSYMCFNSSFGLLNNVLQYEEAFAPATGAVLLNLGLVLAVGVLIYLLSRFKALRYALAAAVIAFVTMAGLNSYAIAAAAGKVQQMQSADQAASSFSLSTKGKNVVVFMLDRAMSTYLPFILEEKPELKETFAGFTNYQNTLSFSTSTNGAVPALFGGYEYTPVELNKRDTEALSQKHNEAHMVLPQLFADNGYVSTVANPVYLNYRWVSDFSFFQGKDYQGIKIANSFMDIQKDKLMVQQNNRNFFAYSVMKSAPLALQSVLYDRGQYNNALVGEDEKAYAGQVVYDRNTAYGYGNFMSEYSVLENLASYTRVKDSSDNTFLILTNDATHEPQLLQLPQYEPSLKVDNTAVAQPTVLTTSDGKTLKMETASQVAHYQSNMAALLRVGEWLEYLRQNGVYDNTRIILVGDHGRYLNQVEGFQLHSGDKSVDLQYFAPLLMVKDFDATEFTVSDEFMTIADVPTLATAGLIENPVNPFTGKPINSEEKTAHPQLVANWTKGWEEVGKNNGNTFIPTGWLSVTDNIWDINNWQFSPEEVVLKEHKLPQ